MALENKLNITDSAELAREEERISKRKAAKLKNCDNVLYALRKIIVFK